ncbi:uncharacterized protein BO97DRAFT_472486 [Aspergillus homomorphus CBS 101889]|uniref:Concanavalin A-like lectin/glucanase n=1 Tax=Aspergillus homomorphus (strain CBS 101889) TaxID=1450537 RepID=A0A395HMT2_ASPHC|nr:hypothetical protein BO97DRAFT_472486 [Aspergillus homomorphus CBS 101889]RAL09242.1 hypothetical protein BO97DRAFT_472486 [Aspergillus homomorphus CBS 101889]
MRYAYTTAPLVLALRAAAYSADSWTFGYGFYMGPPTSGQITKATYSIVAPSVPQGATVKDRSDEVWESVWIGVSATQSDSTNSLYQPLFNWSPDQASQGCSASADEWCVAASTYTPTGQIGQAYVPVPKHSQVDFESMSPTPSPTPIYVENNKVYQVVTMDGTVISRQNDALNNPLQYLYSSDECYTGSGTCGTLQGYSWNNITITLSEADKSFGNTLYMIGSTSSDEFSTSDGGKIWHADAVVIPTDGFTANS